MPRKIRELIQDLRSAGFYEILGGGKGVHRKFAHARYAGAVTLSGQTGMTPNRIKKGKLSKLLSRWSNER